MLALLSILFALGLLGLTVYALHRHQTMEVEFNVDRNIPLPPLQPDTAPRPLKPGPGRTGPEPDSTAPSGPATTAVRKPAKSASNTWQETITALKNAGEFEEAYGICRQHFPLWGAYNQYCMLLRTELKTTAPASPARERQLLSLYRTAAMAELLHDKSNETPHLTNNELRQLDLDAIRGLDYPYQAIGYAHLRMIRKGDIKQLVELWGRPRSHVPPRAHHADWWRQHTSSIAHKS